MSANEKIFCDTGKNVYVKKGDASSDIVSLSKKSKHVFSTYKCDECGYYHISTTSKKIKKYRRK